MKITRVNQQEVGLGFFLRRLCGPIALMEQNKTYLGKSLHAQDKRREVAKITTFNDASRYNSDADGLRLPVVWLRGCLLLVTEQPPMRVRSVQDVNITPFEWTLRRGDGRWRNRTTFVGVIAMSIASVRNREKGEDLDGGCDLHSDEAARKSCDSCDVLYALATWKHKFELAAKMETLNPA